MNINNSYKINLYIPAFPERSFYTAIDKYLNLNGETVASHIVLSMTKACPYKCEHCYQKNDGGPDLAEEKLISTAQVIQNVGVSLFDIEGGEPLIKLDRLLKLLKSLDNRSELWINTTGYSLTYEKALALKDAGLFGAMISIHHPDIDMNDKFVGYQGAFNIACKAINIFQKVGITAVINCCPSLELINNQGIEKMLELAKNLNCSFIQLIHEKPAGSWVNKGNSLMDPELLSSLCNLTVKYNTDPSFKDYPAITMQVFESCPEAFGCTAGGIERFYINANGEVQPCEFMNISCGNVRDEDFMVIYNRMRQYFHRPGLNWLCNTEYCNISNYINDHNITDFPVRKELALQLIEKFDKGKPVPLFERMKLCDKV